MPPPPLPRAGFEQTLEIPCRRPLKDPLHSVYFDASGSSLPTSHSRSDDKITTLELDDRVGPPVSAQLVYRERHQISTMALLSVVSFSFSYAPGSLTPTPMVGQRVAVSAPQLLPRGGEFPDRN